MSNRVGRRKELRFPDEPLPSGAPLIPMQIAKQQTGAPSGAAAILFFAALPAFNLMYASEILAQSSSTHKTAAVPAFEVAAIRPNSPTDLRIGFWFTPTGISVTGAPLQMIVGEAFHVGGDHIFGLPAWVKSARYDIQAKVSESELPRWRRLTIDQQCPALLSLLVDRFNLRFHHETRRIPVYVITVAKGGSKLKESSASREFLMWSGTDQLVGRRSTIDDLILELRPLVGDRTIVNKTGLAGVYDFTMQLTRDDTSQTASSPEANLPGASSTQDPDAGNTALFAALREQLGLKLELQNLPSDVIVIDHIEGPSAN